MKNLYKKIIDTVPVFFFLWDRDKKETIFISDKFYDQSAKNNYAPKKPQEDLRQYIHQDSRKAYDDFFANLSEENNYNDKIELRAAGNLPGIKWMELKTFPVMDQEDAMKYIAGHITDITYSKESHKLLEEQVESLDIVTFMLAHELSAPVANIMGLAEMLKSKIKDPDLVKYQPLYDTIYNYGREILTLAQGLVSLIDLQSSKDQLKMEEVKLKPLAEKLIKEFYLKSKYNAINVSCTEINTEVTVYVHAEKFKNAIKELLVYLLNHKSVAQISIIIPSCSNADQTLIWISARGANLSKESIQTVLDRSLRLSTLDVKRQQVRGMLELIIAKEIIELHQGRLELLDDSQQQGFVICLPRKQ